MISLVPLLLHCSPLPVSKTPDSWTHDKEGPSKSNRSTSPPLPPHPGTISISLDMSTIPTGPHPSQQRLPWPWTLEGSPLPSFACKIWCILQDSCQTPAPPMKLHPYPLCSSVRLWSSFCIMYIPSFWLDLHVASHMKCLFAFLFLQLGL